MISLLDFLTFCRVFTLDPYSNLDPYVLSIGVEGAEIDVLRGNDWAEFTPPIIVVEEHTPPWAKVSEIS